MSNLVDVGQLSSPYGIKGWLKVQSYTRPSTNIFNYQPWRLKTRHGFQSAKVVRWKTQGKVFLVQLRDIESRNQAEKLSRSTILIEKILLPKLSKGDYYWHQLQGCRVVSCYQGEIQDLGLVRHMMATGANDVLVVAGDDRSLDRRERLIPYLLGQFVEKVDLTDKVIFVNWDPEF